MDKYLVKDGGCRQVGTEGFEEEQQNERVEKDGTPIIYTNISSKPTP